MGARLFFLGPHWLTDYRTLGVPGPHSLIPAAPIGVVNNQKSAPTWFHMPFGGASTVSNTKLHCGPQWGAHSFFTVKARPPSSCVKDKKDPLWPQALWLTCQTDDLASSSLILTITLYSHYYCTHFAVEETETQRGLVICPRSHS